MQILVRLAIIDNDKYQYQCYASSHFPDDCIWSGSIENAGQFFDFVKAFGKYYHISKIPHDYHKSYFGKEILSITTNQANGLEEFFDLRSEIIRQLSKEDLDTILKEVKGLS